LWVNGKFYGVGGSEEVSVSDWGPVTMGHNKEELVMLLKLAPVAVSTKSYTAIVQDTDSGQYFISTFPLDAWCHTRVDLRQIKEISFRRLKNVRVPTDKEFLIACSEKPHYTYNFSF
jgi:hypothetical protein